MNTTEYLSVNEVLLLHARLIQVTGAAGACATLGCSNRQWPAPGQPLQVMISILICGPRPPP